MRTTYGVIWREGSGPLGRGKLELLPDSLRLDGVAASQPLAREVAYEELADVRVGRSAAERIAGRPSLVLEPRTGATISVGSIAEAGVIGELAERIAVRRAGRRVAVVLPLREGSTEAVRLLLSQGPPFDPDAVGLDRHEVFLSPTEAVFVFESDLGARVLEPLLAEPVLWERAADWLEHLDGPPRVAESAYAWRRGVDQSLLPPGLRNGS